MDEPKQLFLVQEFPGGRQTFGLAASASGVVFADAEGRSVGRIDADGLLTVLRLPVSDGRPHGLAAAEGDEIWLAEWSNTSGNRVSRLSASGDSYDFLDLDGFGTPRNVVVTGGDVFFTVGSKLGRLRWSEQRVELHAFRGETGWRQVESTPLAVDPRGGVWVGFGGAAGFIARFDPRDETWESLEMGDLLPIGLAMGLKGELWFTDFNHSQIGRVTGNRDVERWDHPGNPFGVAISRSGDIWVAEFSLNRLTRIDPGSGESIESVPLPTSDSQPQNLTFDALGALWYTGQRGVVSRYGPSVAMPSMGEQVEVDLHDPPVRLKDLARTGRGLNADLPPDPAPIRVSFSDHPSFTPPPAEVVIWRYVDLPKLVSVLASRALFFARLDTQADPFEGSLPQPDGSGLNFDQVTSGGLDADQLVEFMKMQRESLGVSRPRALVSCWHMNDYESMAMWDLYAQSGHGIAIRSTSSRLVESLHQEQTSEVFLPPAYLGVVRYIDYATAVVAPNTALAFLTLKRTSFAHERELRAVVLSNNRVQGGQNVACDVETLIESIFVAPGAPGWFREAVQHVVARFGLNREVKQSDLDVDPVLVESRLPPVA